MFIGCDIQSVYTEGHNGIIYQNRTSVLERGTNLISDNFIWY